MKEKTDYTLTYKNNTNPGDAAVVLKMKGNYSGTKEISFRIEARSLSDITADPVIVAYKKNGKVQHPIPVLLLDEEKLKYKKGDLKFSWPSEGNYTDIGTYKIHVEPGNTEKFKDSLDVDLIITELTDLKNVKVSLSGDLTDHRSLRYLRSAERAHSLQKRIMRFVLRIIIRKSGSIRSRLSEKAVIPVKKR